MSSDKAFAYTSFSKFRFSKLMLVEVKIGGHFELLLLKLILSCPEIFTPFSKTFLVPILTLIGAGSLTGSEVVNYVISDLLIMLLSWSNQTGVIPDGNEMEKMSQYNIMGSWFDSTPHNVLRILCNGLCECGDPST